MRTAVLLIAVIPWLAMLVVLSGCADVGTRTGPPTSKCGAECQKWLRR